MMNVTSGLESLKNKIDDLDVDKLKTVPLAVKKSDAVDENALNKSKHNVDKDCLDKK